MDAVGTWYIYLMQNGNDDKLGKPRTSQTCPSTTIHRSFAVLCSAICCVERSLGSAIVGDGNRQSSHRSATDGTITGVKGKQKKARTGPNEHEIRQYSVDVSSILILPVPHIRGQRLSGCFRTVEDARHSANGEAEDQLVG